MSEFSTMLWSISYCQAKTLFGSWDGSASKSVINPRQINPVNEIFTPTTAEIDKAKRIIAALKEAEAKGSGVVSLNGKMIDKPVVLRAERTLELARAVHIVVD